MQKLDHHYTVGSKMVLELEIFLLIGFQAPLEPAIKYTIDHPPPDYWYNPLFFGSPSDDSEKAWNSLIHRK